MQLTPEIIKHVFRPAYFKRGVAYYEQGEVIALDVTSELKNKIVFTSQVAGSYDSTYQQKVVIKDRDGDIHIAGYCSCPVDYNCKHVVAACLTYIADFHTKGDYTNIVAEAWLDDFVALLHHDPQQAYVKDKFLIYLISYDEQSRETIVQFKVTHVLKKGGLAKGKLVSFPTLKQALYYPPAYLCDEDIEIIRLLQGRDIDYAPICKIEGSIGFVALQKMMATERCFCEDFHQPPLEWGEQRALEQQWVFDEAGNAKLQLSVKPSAVIIPTEPALFLDLAKHEAGVLDNAYIKPEQIKMMLNAPVIPAAQVEAVSQRLAVEVPAQVLTPPQKVNIQSIEGEQPTARLLLCSLALSGSDVRVIQLRFLYAEHEISVLPDGDVRRIEQGKDIILLHRNFEAEYKLLDRLINLGFESCFIEGYDEDLYLHLQSRSDMEVGALWISFLQEHIPVLRDEGWHIEIDDSFHMQVNQVDAWYAEINETGHDWFDLRFDVEINGKKQALLPLITQALQDYELQHLPERFIFQVVEGEYIEIPSAEVKPILDILYELYDGQVLSEDGGLTMSQFDMVRVADLEQENANIAWHGGEQIRKLGQQLKDFSGIEPVAPPQGLQAELRPYQQEGLNWLQFLRSYQLHGLLADDMGLGKTIQTLAHLLLEKEQGRMDKPCLIIAPTSLVGNWRREARIFAPALKVLVLQGADRKQYFNAIRDYDVVISTYPLLLRDKAILTEHEYHMLVLDEAQVIKNPKAKASKIARQLKAAHKLCLTGTPMENHLGELWSLFDFLMPGFLGDARQFKQTFRTPIEVHGQADRQQQLVQRIKPFMLRRTKSEVASELPEKTEIIRSVALEQQQAALYESIRMAMEKKVQETIASKGLARSHITILDALLKLRQVCCDPRILSLKQAKKVKESAKLELLLQMLPEMLEEGRKTLLFSQFTKMFPLIEQELKARRITYSKLTGQTRNRDAAIEKFKSGKADVFLVSLKAGGVGLNLTEADTVIHYDPWWNPAAENQATDRAHRIGQDKAVFVYKLVVENSVEEKILAMQEKKQALADAVYQSKDKQDTLNITAEDMQSLFAPL